MGGHARTYSISTVRLNSHFSSLLSNVAQAYGGFADSVRLVQSMFPPASEPSNQGSDASRTGAPALRHSAA